MVIKNELLVISGDQSVINMEGNCHLLQNSGNTLSKPIA